MVALTPAQLGALRAVRASWPGAEVVLIGAQALGAHIDLSYRETDDLDLAVAISLAEFPGELLEQPGWKRDPRRAQRFRGPDGQVLDLVPAGTALRDEGALEWPGGHRMSLVGFDLAFEHAETVDLEGIRFGLPSAPALACLKMRSWLDRPAEREKDLGDLAHLMARYVDDDDARRWDDETPTELAFEEVSAFLLGVDLAAIARPHHRPHVQRFLEAVGPARLSTGGPWVVDAVDAAERALEAFRSGFGA